MHDVVIIGAGLAGLCCARELIRQGHACLLLEASDVGAYGGNEGRGNAFADVFLFVAIEDRLMKDVALATESIPECVDHTLLERSLAKRDFGRGGHQML
jgi:glycine/D-amino acid oxidase-like deaminating enzyme